MSPTQLACLLILVGVLLVLPTAAMGATLPILARFATERLEWYAVVNYTRGEESDGGATVAADRIPPLNGRFGVVWQPRDEWRLESYLDFAGRQDRLSPRDEDDPRINPLGTPGWGTFNLLLSWQASERLELGARLLNLGDNNYREHGSGIDAPGHNFGLWLNTLF